MKLQLVLLACTFALICADKPPVKFCKELCVKPPTPDDCLSQGLAFVPKMGTVNCCDRCAKPSEVTKPRCQPQKCELVKCAGQTIKDCKPGQVLVPRDGRCYCCATCVDYWVKPICNEFCVKPPTPDECLSQGLAFVPKMGTVNCCDRCAKPSEVTKPRCQPLKCEVVKCAGQKIEDCKPGQVLVPADGRCYCCARCVDYWVKPDCPHKEE